MKELVCRVLYEVGDHLDTDVMTPGKYLNSYEPEYLASICMKDVYPDFQEKMKSCGAMVGGINFGCGSSRETAPIALKAAGVQVIIAKQFARIFYRNSFNIGLPCLISEEAGGKIALGDELAIDFTEGKVRNLTSGETIRVEPVPPALLEMLDNGGLMENLKKRYHVKE